MVFFNGNVYIFVGTSSLGEKRVLKVKTLTYKNGVNYGK